MVGNEECMRASRLAISEKTAPQSTPMGMKRRAKWAMRWKM